MTRYASAEPPRSHSTFIHRKWYLYHLKEITFAHYIADGSLHNMLIRTSMKNVSDLICRLPYIMQCHRAFIVNLRYVAKVESRSSGIALVMRYGDENVLVSKQYTAEVKERIKNPTTGV